MSDFIQKENVIWKEVKYLRQGETFNYDFKLILPEPLANWDVFDYWERERVNSMCENLTKDDVLFDIGAEHGWMSIVFAKYCKIFLIEPTKEFWPNIYQTWKHNISENPIGCFCGLIGEKSNTKEDNFGWPDNYLGDLIDKNKYQYIHNHETGTKIITVEDLIKRSKIKPTALTIDVEGAELIVLKSAEKLLKENDIKVWVSIHGDLLEQYGSKDKDIYDFMEKLGYKSNFLAEDHEAHVYFRK